MNKILQKRIEEAAKRYNARAYSPFDDPYELSKEFERDCYCFKEGATFALQNQWISVEEALPPKEDNDSSITVLVHCQKGWCGIDYYRYKYDEWLNNGNSVTHWMMIPTINKEEK